MGSNLGKLDQSGQNRAKNWPNRVKQGQMRLKRLEWGFNVVNGGKPCKKGVKLGLIGLNQVKTGCQKGANGEIRSQTGPNKVKCGHGQLGSDRIKCGQIGPNRTKLDQTRPNGARYGQMI